MRRCCGSHHLCWQRPCSYYIRVSTRNDCNNWAGSHSSPSLSGRSMDRILFTRKEQAQTVPFVLEPGESLQTCTSTQIWKDRLSSRGRRLRFHVGSSLFLCYNVSYQIVTAQLTIYIQACRNRVVNNPDLMILGAETTLMLGRLDSS